MTPASPSTSIAHPHLQELAAHAEEVAAGVKHLRETVSRYQLTWKPAPDVWNILECIDHLIVTDGLYLARIRAAMEKADRTQPEKPYRPSLFGKRFIAFLAPESKRTIKTFRVFEPAAALTDVITLNRFLDQQHDILTLIRQADAVNINTGKFSSPLTRLIRFTVGEALTVIVTHQRRHLQQARNLTQRPGFPEV